MKPGSPDRHGHTLEASGRPRGGDSPTTGVMPPRKPIPPSRTHAEEFYYLKQMQAGTPLVLVLEGGERVCGRLEWYDEQALKIHREDGPNLLIFKRHIVYMHKDEQATHGQS